MDSRCVRWDALEGGCDGDRDMLLGDTEVAFGSDGERVGEAVGDIASFSLASLLIPLGRAKLARRYGEMRQKNLSRSFSQSM